VSSLNRNVSLSLDAIGQIERYAAKEDYLGTSGVGLLRVPNGLVLEEAEGFVRKADSDGD
jgi:hypothetical protein